MPFYLYIIQIRFSRIILFFLFCFPEYIAGKGNKEVGIFVEQVLGPVVEPVHEHRHDANLHGDHVAHVGQQLNVEGDDVPVVDGLGVEIPSDQVGEHESNDGSGEVHGQGVVVGVAGHRQHHHGVADEGYYYLHHFFLFCTFENSI